MFDIVQDIDDGSGPLFCVYYSGTLVETFYSHSDAEDFVSSTMAEMNIYSVYKFDEPWLAL